MQGKRKEKGEKKKKEEKRVDMGHSLSKSKQGGGQRRFVALMRENC